MEPPQRSAALANDPENEESRATQTAMAVTLGATRRDGEPADYTAEMIPPRDGEHDTGALNRVGRLPEHDFHHDGTTGAVAATGATMLIVPTARPR